MINKALILALAAALSGCAQAQMVGATAIEHRRVMNDMQARATIAATCDIALGAWLRLSPVEQAAVRDMCSPGSAMPEQLRALE